MVGQFRPALAALIEWESVTGRSHDYRHLDSLRRNAGRPPRPPSRVLDVTGRLEVGLADAQIDDVDALGPHGFGLGGDLEGRRRANAADSIG